jgi:uncharacterized protein (DUF433 family)
VRTPLYSLALTTFLVGLVVALVFARSYPSVALASALVAGFGLAGTWIAARFMKPAEVRFGAIVTFRDLAMTIAGEQPDPVPASESAWRMAGLAARTSSSTIGWTRGSAEVPQLTRITRDPAVMGGKPCIRGMRVTVGTLVGLVAAGRTRDEILRESPYLEAEDIAEALSYRLAGRGSRSSAAQPVKLLVDMNPAT